MERHTIDQPLRVRRLRAAAKLPAHAAGSVGYDIHADLSEVPMPSLIPNVNRHYVDLNQGKLAEVPTGIEVALPPGAYGRILPLFDQGPGSGIAVVNDVLDATFRGELMVTLENSGTRRFQFRRGYPIATLVLHAVATPDVVEVDALDGAEPEAVGTEAGTPA